MKKTKHKFAWVAMLVGLGLVITGYFTINSSTSIEILNRINQGIIEGGVTLFLIGLLFRLTGIKLT